MKYYDTLLFVCIFVASECQDIKTGVIDFRLFMSQQDTAGFTKNNIGNRQHWVPWIVIMHTTLGQALG
jgi:hypothetical protein